MRPFAVLLLVASVLHSQLAMGCHCMHETNGVSAHDGCRHGGLFDGHSGHGGHSGLFGAICDHDHPLPAPQPCDGCAECEKGDPVGLRMGASSDLAEVTSVVTWAALIPAGNSQDAVRWLLRKPSTVPDGARSLLESGTLLRI